jgi:hypothetical protein
MIDYRTAWVFGAVFILLLMASCFIIPEYVILGIILFVTSLLVFITEKMLYYCPKCKNENTLAKIYFIPLKVCRNCGLNIDEYYRCKKNA